MGQVFFDDEDGMKWWGMDEQLTIGKVNMEGMWDRVSRGYAAALCLAQDTLFIRDPAMMARIRAG
eukprot:gene30590-5059_t